MLPRHHHAVVALHDEGHQRRDGVARAVVPNPGWTLTPLRPNWGLRQTIASARGFILRQRRFPSRHTETSSTPPTQRSTRCSPPVLTSGSQSTTRPWSTTPFQRFSHTAWARAFQTHETTPDRFVITRGRGMNSKCCWACLVHSVGSLLSEGHRTRVYIPYGEKWYEYSIRRLQENPTIGTHVAKSVSDAVDQSSVITCASFSFERPRLAFWIHTFLDVLLGRSGLIEPNRPPFHACRRSRGVRGAK